VVALVVGEEFQYVWSARNRARKPGIACLDFFRERTGGGPRPNKPRSLEPTLDRRVTTEFGGEQAHSGEGGRPVGR